MSINPDTEYKTITTALETGNRIVYNTTTRQFESVSRSKAKELASNSQYETTLPKLNERVQAFIQKEGIQDGRRSTLKSALSKRTTSLKSRTILWGRSKWEAAVKDLSKLDTVIKDTKKLQGSIPTYEETASSTGPHQKDVEQKTIFVEKALNEEITTSTSTGTQEAQSSAPTGAAPPPPPPLGPIVMPRFENEPAALKIDRLKYKDKEASALQREIAQIDKYTEALEAALVPIQKDIKQHEVHTTFIAQNTKEYYEPDRQQYINLKGRMPQLMHMWNHQKGGDIRVGNGSLPLYTDKEYEAEVKYRAALPPDQQKAYRENSPLQLTNKLSYAFIVAYSAMKTKEANVVKENDKILTLIDADGKEIMPVEIQKFKGKDIISSSVPEGRNSIDFVRFSQVKLPLAIKETLVTKDQEGALTRQIAEAREAKEAIEAKKSGEIPFKDFASRLKTKTDQLDQWKNASKNRTKQIDAPATTQTTITPSSGATTWQTLCGGRDGLEAQGNNWSNVDERIKNKLGINPSGTIVELVASNAISEN